MLKIRTMNDVFRSLTNHITARCSRLTDFNVGSALRTLCEAVSIQFEEFYYSVSQHTKSAIENGTYEAFGFNRIEASPARAVMRVNFTSPLTADLLFPEGTTFCTSPDYGYIYFQTTEDYTALSGDSFIQMTVTCTETGTVGNVPANAITTIVTSNASIQNVVQSHPAEGGKDAETDADRKERFKKYINSLAKGTEDALIYGALEVDGVAGAYVESMPGYVRLLVHDIEGNLPSDLKTAVETNIENYRAAGIAVEVDGVTLQEVYVGCEILLTKGETPSVYAPLFTNIITRVVNTRSVGQGLYAIDIMNAIKSAYPYAVLNITFTPLYSGSTLIYPAFTDIEGVAGVLLRSAGVDVSCVNS